MVKKRTRSAKQEEHELNNGKSAKPALGKKPDYKHHFFKSVRTLNSQYSQFITQELAKNPAANLEDSARDYNSYVAALEDRYLRMAGNVLTCGNGDCGQLGLGVDDEDKSIYRPRIIPSLKSQLIVMVACGGLHNVACTVEGRVFTWGCNDDGALGRVTNGEEDEVTPSEVVISGEVIRQVSAGDCQSLCVTLSGDVYGWGCYKDKEGKQWYAPQQGGRHAAKTCKRVQKVPLRVLNLERVLEVRSGASANIALDQGGRLYSWGIGESDELGRPVCNMKKDTNTEERDYDFEGILRDHLTPGLMCSDGVPVDQSVGIFKSIGAGAYHMLAITGKGSKVYACGLNNYGQLGLGDRENRKELCLIKSLDFWGATSVTGGAFHSLALCDDGKMFAFGRCDYGQLGIALSDRAAGGFETYPRLVEIPENNGKVIQIDAGTNHSLCVTEKQEAYSWGFGDNGALGLGESDADQVLPKKIDMNQSKLTKGMKIAYVTGGGTHSSFIGYFPKK